MKTTKTVLMTAIASLILLSATQARAYVLNGKQWPGSHPRIPYYVSTNLQGNVPYDNSATFQTVQDHIWNAANTWNVQGASEFKFTYAGTTVVTQVADDGINAVVFNTGTCPGPSGCTAMTYYHQTNGVFRGFDIVLYKYRGASTIRVLWKTQITYMTHMDLWTIVLHEFGHALGLDHSNYAGVVMGCSCGAGCVRRNLYADDVNGTLTLYRHYSSEGIWASTSNAQAGSNFTLFLSYPEARHQNYAIYMSTSGMAGFPLRYLNPKDSRILGINNDFFPTDNYPEIFVGFEGTLSGGGGGPHSEGQGLATATVNLPADPNFFGSSDLYFTVVTMSCSFLNCYEDVGVGVHVHVNP